MNYRFTWKFGHTFCSVCEIYREVDTKVFARSMKTYQYLKQQFWILFLFFLLNDIFVSCNGRGKFKCLWKRERIFSMIESAMVLKIKVSSWNLLKRFFSAILSNPFFVIYSLHVRMIFKYLIFNRYLKIDVIIRSFVHFTPFIDKMLLLYR